MNIFTLFCLESTFRCLVLMISNRSCQRQHSVLALLHVPLPLPLSLSIYPFQILSKDSVTVSVDAVVYYRVYDPTISITNVENAQNSTRLLAATTLRNVLGTKTLGEVLTDRETISASMLSILDEATDPWGIKVERVEMWAVFYIYFFILNSTEMHTCFRASDGINRRPM